MSKIIESSMKTKVIFSDDMKHRYLLYKEWDKSKPNATVIMLNPSIADEVTMDYTTMYVINNLNNLDFGSVNIVNLFSSLTTIKGDMGSNKENDNTILKAIEQSKIVILAWGRGNDTNKKVQDRIEEITKMIGKNKDKCKLIADEIGVAGYHPLASKVRMAWRLIDEKWKTKEQTASKDKTKQKVTKKDTKEGEKK